MSVPKEKLLSVLNAKLKGKSVSKTLKQKWAKRHAEKIETEDDIDEYIDDRLDDIMDASQESDQRVAQALKEQKPGEPVKPTKQPGEASDDDDDLTGMDAGQIKLFKMMQGFGKRLDGLEAGNTAQTLKQRFLAHPDLKGIPQELLEMSLPTKEEDFDAAVERAADKLAKYKEEDPDEDDDDLDDDDQQQVETKPFVRKPNQQQQQQQAAAKKGGEGKPAGGGKGTGKGGEGAGDSKQGKNKKEASADEIAAVMPGLMPGYNTAQPNK